MTTTGLPTVVDRLKQRATDTPGRIAFTVGDQVLTYARLKRDAADLGRRLARIGLAPGHSCVIALSAPLDVVRLCYACQWIAAVPVVVDPTTWESVREQRIAAVRPTVVFNDYPSFRDLPVTARPLELALGFLGGVTPAGGRVLRTPGPSDPAYMRLTVAPGGNVRPAIVSHGALAATLDASAAYAEVGPHDRLAGWTPLEYSVGMVPCVFGGPWWGIPVHLLERTATHVGHWLDLIASSRATLTFAPDYAYRVATVARFESLPELASLRLAVTTGECVRAETVHDFERRFGVNRVVQPAYGLTEATLLATACRPGEAFASERGVVSCGRPLPGVDVAIVDRDRRRLPPGIEGDIWVRGPGSFDGYHDDGSATQAAFVDDWLVTGDIGWRDTAGRLYVRTRRRPIVKRGGRTIASREVEGRLVSLQHVNAVAVVGVPLDSSLTEDLVVVIESRTATRDDLVTLATLSDMIVREATSVRPGRIVLVTPGTLPRDENGGVHYADLRDHILDRRLDAATLYEL